MALNLHKHRMGIESLRQCTTLMGKEDIYCYEENDCSVDIAYVDIGFAYYLTGEYLHKL